MKKSILAALVAVLWLVSSSARADENAGGSQIGSRTMPPGASAVAGGSGFPSALWLQWATGVTDAFDVGVRADVYGASPLDGLALGPAAGLSVPMRLSLGSSGPVAFALRVAPDVVRGQVVDDFCHAPGQTRWHCHDGSGTAMGVDVAILGGVSSARARFVGGIGSPIHVAGVDDRAGAELVVPMTVIGGIEVPIVRGVELVGLAQPGVAFHRSPDDTSLDGYLRFEIGLQSAL